jgi:hypothetical protein
VVDVKYYQEGTGLVINEGFSVPDGTGYVIRQSNYGCEPVFPGFFADKFNYSAVANGSPGALGNFWICGAGGPDVVSTAGGGFVQTLAACHGGFVTSGTRLFRVNCGSVPQLGHQSSQITWNALDTFTGIFGDGVNTFPLGAGGPSALISIDGSSRFVEYQVLARNDPTQRRFQVTLQFLGTRAAVYGTYDLVTYTTTYSDWDGQPPNNHLGWTGVPHVLKLEVTPGGGGVNNCKVYLDGAEIINTNNNEAPQLGWFGFFSGPVATGIACEHIQTSKLSNFIGRQL